MDNKQAHLEMIQGVINRLSNNSFLLKGWSVILISALFALAASNEEIYFIYITYFPFISFWILDGYFLWQERLFRKLYDHVRILKEKDIDYSMDTSIIKDKVKTWIEVTFSLTLRIFHGTVFLTITIILIAIKIKGGC